VEYSSQESVKSLLAYTASYSKRYCRVLPSNVRNNFWVLDLIPRFTGYSPGGITINYNTLNPIVCTLC
jgi:hypothetical protein